MLVFDCKVVYVGSANLTSAGFGMKGEDKRNFEAGILTDDPAIVIASWLADYTKNDVRYVIIDDEYVCLESQVPHFILTNPYDGITEDITDRVIAILEQ